MTGVDVAPMTVLFGFIAFAVSSFVWKRKPFARLVPVDVLVTGDALDLGGTRIARRWIRRVELIPVSKHLPVVRVSRAALPDIDVAVADVSRGHDLLRALGFDPSQTSATYHVGSLMAVRYWWTVPLFIVGFLVAAFHDLYVVGLCAAPVLFLLLLWPTALRVGTDQVSIHWLWIRERIEPLTILQAARFDEGGGRNRRTGVKLELDDGRVVTLPISNEELSATVAERIQSVKDLARRAQQG